MKTSVASCFWSFCAELHPKGAQPRRCNIFGCHSSSCELIVAVVLLPVLRRLFPVLVCCSDYVACPARMFSAANLSKDSIRASILSTVVAVLLIFC